MITPYEIIIKIPFSNLNNYFNFRGPPLLLQHGYQGHHLGETGRFCRAGREWWYSFLICNTLVFSSIFNNFGIYCINNENIDNTKNSIPFNDISSLSFLYESVMFFFQYFLHYTFVTIGLNGFDTGPRKRPIMPYNRCWQKVKFPHTNNVVKFYIIM